MMHILLFLALLVSVPAHAAQFAVYRDQGVWKESYQDIVLFLKKSGHRVDTLNAEAIRAGKLTNERYQGLLVPGGKSWDYLSSLGATGGEAIRRFVVSGGGYMGFCAGAFYATSDREGGHTTGPYGIGLLDGIAQDPKNLGIPGFKDGMKRIAFQLLGFPKFYSVSFLEGVQFQLTEEQQRDQDVRVIARYSWNGGIAAVTSRFGQGRVFLSGPHPEVEENRHFPSRLYRKDPDSEWPILRRFTAWVLGGVHPDLRTD